MKSEFWYRPFSWIPPVFETVKDKKRRDRVKLKIYGFFKRNLKTGTVITSGEGDNFREYVVQKSGAIVRLNKKPSKRDLHRAKSK